MIVTTYSVEHNVSSNWLHLQRTAYGSVSLWSKQFLNLAVLLN